MQNDFSDIDRIIALHLGGEAAQAEQDALQAWLCQSESNRAYFSALVGAPQPNVDKAWKKFSQHIRQEQAAPPKHVALWDNSSVLLRYAAAVAALVCLSIFAWLRYDGATTALQMIAENQQPQAQKHVLHDNSTVFLSKGSKIAYVGSFGKGKREVKLEGEAFFEVSSTGNGQFLVHAEETLIKDIGTSFNVQAYPTSDSVVVFVQSGEVQLYTNGSEGVRVQAGEVGIYNKRTKTFTHLKAGETNIVISSAKLFVFKDKPLSEAVALIGKEYNVHIAVGDTAAAKLPISVTFDGESIEEIVEVIGETLDLSVAHTDSVYLLKKK